MNEQLNKLIKQYSDQYNLPVAAKVNLTNLLENCDPMVNDFVNFILASRPTCGKEQRLFLNEIEKKGIVNDGYHIMLSLSCSKVSDLQKVINGE